MLAYLPCHLPKELVFLLVYWTVLIMSKAVFMSEPIIIVIIVSISILAYFGWTLDRFASHLCPKKIQAKTEGKHEENQTKNILEFRPPQLKAAEANPTPEAEAPNLPVPVVDFMSFARYSSTPKAKDNVMDISTSKPRGRRAAGWPRSTGLSITPQQKIKNKTTKKEQIESTQATLYTQRTMPGCTGASGTPRRRGWNKAKSFFYLYPRRKNCMRIHQGWCAIWGWRRKNCISNQILSLAWFKKWSV